MKSYILTGFVIGVVVGATGTYFYLEKKFNAEIDDIIEEEKEQLRDSIRKYNNHDQNVVTETFKKEVEDRSKELERPKIPGIVVTEDDKPENIKQYDSIMSNYKKPALEEVVKNVPPLDKSNPYVIDALTYSNERDDFDKVMYQYYEEDDVLVDDNEEVIVDPDTYIGPEALLCFADDERYEPDIVYVRNERLSLDIEIERIPGSYSELVLGYADEETPKRKGEVDE